MTHTRIPSPLALTFVSLAALGACAERGASGSVDLAKSKIEMLSSAAFADGVDKVDLRVTLRDARGVALAGRLVEFRAQASGLTIDQPGTTDADGCADAGLASTNSGAIALRVLVDPGPNEVELDAAFAVDFLTPPSPSVSAVTLARSTAPANGETEIGIQALVSNTSGDPLPGHTVRFSVDDAEAVVTQPSAKTNASGIATGSVRSTKVSALRVVATVQSSKRPMLLHAQPSASFLADPLVVDDGELVYGEASVSTPRLRSYSVSGGTMSSESSLVATSTTIRSVVDRFSPVSRHERLAAVLAEDGSAARLSVLRQVGEGWSEVFAETGVPFAHVDKRAFDLCFEESSGDALLVWSDGTARPRFRHKSGATWTDAASLPINDGAGPGPELSSGAPLYFELVAEPGSNAITLVYVDAAADLVTMRWDGALWETASATLHTQSAATNAVSGVPHNRCFDLAYEASAKGALLAWGDTSFPTGFRWSRRDPSTGAWSSAASFTLQNGLAEHVDLAADPSSDRVAIGCFDLGGTERLGLAMWNGSAWVQGVEIDSQIRDVNHSARADWPGELAWVGSSGVAVCVYPDNAPARLDWCRYTVGGGWSAQSAVTISGKGFTESAVLRSFGTSNRLLALFSDSYGQLYGARYDGSSWTVLASSSPLEATLSTSAGRAFDYAVKQR